MALTQEINTKSSVSEDMAPASGWPHKMLIDDSAVTGEGAEIAVEHPGDGGVFTRFAGASDQQVEAAIASARKAADVGEWAAMRPAERVGIVLKFVAALRTQAEVLENIVIAEGGCPIGSLVMPTQVKGPLDTVEDQLALYLTLPESESNPLPLDDRINAMGTVFQSMKRYVPHGVVVAISAYNFPFFLNIWKLAPALATGNCVILRPSPLTPLSALAMVEAALVAGFPKGVLNIVAEAGADGALALTTDPRVDMVSFTGSTDVGKKVMAQAAPTMKRLQLELGGKSAQIYLPDRVDAAANAAAGVCLVHAGQGCVLGTRVLVPETEKADVLAKMAKTLVGIVPGNPLDPATLMGPLINAAQVERCERYVQIAVAAGATIVTGGKRVDKPGHYFEPTILDVPDASNPAAMDEIFGPIVAVIGYRDIDHAVQMANESTFGLSGYVYSADARVALDIAKRIHSGTVNVNIGGAMSGYASSGGHRSSGLGRERGVEGLRIYQELQCLNFAT